MQPVPELQGEIVWEQPRASRDLFHAALDAHGCVLERDRPRTVQINLGKRCNQACRHCHVEAGPKRTEAMSRETLDAVFQVIRRIAVESVDVTGGAPEMHPLFEHIVVTLRNERRRVVVRTNLTIIEEPGYAHLPTFYAAHGVELVASLPCYLQGNVDRQRGRGVFGASVRALRRLNEVGYGRSETGLILALVYNPQGAMLPPPQARLEADYRRELGRRYGIGFTRLIAIANMPIGRFADDLARRRALREYVTLLGEQFNPATVPALMCRTTLNVGWDGALYDCDFNAMIGLPMRGEDGQPLTIRDMAAGKRPSNAIATADHCLGCTAGAGSSCGGTLV